MSDLSEYYYIAFLQIDYYLPQQHVKFSQGSA